jgi:hypothetical protein
MPVLSALMPALKPSSAARSAGEHGLLPPSEDAFASPRDSATRRRRVTESFVVVIRIVILLNN